MVICLGSLVQLCCGEGGTLQTNITGICGECAQCLGHSGFAPTHCVCAFPAYTAQAPGCSAGKLSKAGPGLRALPRSMLLRFRKSLLHKGADSVGPAFCALPRSEQFRQPGACRVHSPSLAVHLITSPVPATRFPGCAAGAPSQVCRVPPLGS